MFCCLANEPTKPHIRARIFFSLAQDNEAWWANFHKDKKIVNWQPFMNNVHCIKTVDDI